MKTLAATAGIGRLEQAFCGEFDLHRDFRICAITLGSWSRCEYPIHATPQVPNVIAQILGDSLDVLVVPGNVPLPNFHVEFVRCEPGTLDVHTHIAIIPGSLASAEAGRRPVVALSKKTPACIGLIYYVQIAICFELVHVNTKGLVSSLQRSQNPGK